MEKKGTKWGEHRIGLGDGGDKRQHSNGHREPILEHYQLPEIPDDLQ